MCHDNVKILFLHRLYPKLFLNGHFKIQHLTSRLNFLFTFNCCDMFLFLFIIFFILLNYFKTMALGSWYSNYMTLAHKVLWILRRLSCSYSCQYTKTETYKFFFTLHFKEQRKISKKNQHFQSFIPFIPLKIINYIIFKGSYIYFKVYSHTEEEKSNCEQ